MIWINFHNDESVRVENTKEFIKIKEFIVFDKLKNILQLVLNFCFRYLLSVLNFEFNSFNYLIFFLKCIIFFNWDLIIILCIYKKIKKTRVL